MHRIYGWRGTIGMMTPGTGQQVEFHRKAPEGVAVCTTLIPLKEATSEGLIEMGKYVEEAANLLARQEPDVILFLCTTGSLIKGPGYDQELIQRIERVSGIPATTTTTAVIEAFHALDVKKILVITPYIDEVNKAEKEFLEESGFEVVFIKGMGLLKEGIRKVRPEMIYSFVKQNFKEQAEAIFISCTGLCVFDIIEPLETDLKRPVITSVQASFWASLRKMKVLDKVEGLGRLLRI